MKRPHARPYRPNPWIGLIGAIGYVVLGAIVAGAVWFAFVVLFSR